VLGLGVARGWAVEPSSAPSLDLEAVLGEVARSNPGIASAREAWRASREKAGPVGAWPDPEVRAEVGTSGEGLRKVEAMQEIPFPGKRSLEAEMEVHAARVQRQRYREKAIETLTRTKLAYARLARAGGRERVLEADLETLKAFGRVVESRVASGKGEAADAFLVELELGELENMLFEARQDRVKAGVELGALMGRDGAPGPMKAVEPGLEDLPSPLPELETMALESSPMVLMAAHDGNHARAMVSRARLAFLPDFKLGLERESMAGGGSETRAMAGLILPLWASRPRGELRGAAAHRAGMEEARRAARLEVLRGVREEETEVRTHLRLAKSYKESLLPLAESALSVAFKAYESGRVDVLKALESARRRSRAEVEAVEQGYHAAEHRAMLEMWVGRELSGKAWFPPVEEGP